MLYVWIGLGVVLFLVLAVLGIAYYCFRIAFYAPKKPPISSEEFPLPEGKVYEP